MRGALYLAAEAVDLESTILMVPRAGTLLLVNWALNCCFGEPTAAAPVKINLRVANINMVCCDIGGGDWAHPAAQELIWCDQVGGQKARAGTGRDIARRSSMADLQSAQPGPFIRNLARVIDPTLLVLRKMSESGLDNGMRGIGYWKVSRW